MAQLRPDHAERMRRARLGLDGLSVGDAFGSRFFNAPDSSRSVPASPWAYSDDTEMAMAVVSNLDRFGCIEPDTLALDFARRYRADPYRGYGLTVRRVLDDIAEGIPWSQAARLVYSGLGSMGNGGAMRVAPIGAYFFDDDCAMVEEARKSAMTTHAHAEGQAGAIAVSVASAWACRNAGRQRSGKAMLEFAAEHTPAGVTRDGIEHAIELDFGLTIEASVEVLGNGSKITAPDTVPFALWCAARHIDDFAEALWSATLAEGDNDTNGAIIGGIVALANGPNSIPGDWLEAREALPS
ncbi:ADP-ribosylglycohydrolase family protein [Singulisphaera sp. PoT]|uniref:ADP-ribosylglycohydrolase family protein n=1 Tax=Singulisphaera sp. PoT TaxID=3411797 RepID=UPI003BF491EC